jgi:hypothetical protein
MITSHATLVAGALMLGFLVSSSAVALSDAPDESAAARTGSSLDVVPATNVPVAMDGVLGDEEEIPETHEWCGLPGEDCLSKGNAGCCSGMCELNDDFPLAAVCL